MGSFFRLFDLELSNDLLMSFSTKDDLNNYLVSRYGSKLITNHLSESSYAISPTFPEGSDDNLGGVGLKYGNATTISTPAIFEIAELPLPKYIYLSIRYANPTNVMCHFDISFRTSKSTYSLVSVVDDQYNNSGYPARIYTDNRNHVYKTFEQGTYHFKVSLDVGNDCSNCFTDGEVTGSLVIGSANTVAGYNTNYVYIKELNILFS